MVIDSHCHILPPSFQERRSELSRRDATFGSLLSRNDAVLADVEALLVDMDRDGVEHSVVMGMGWTDFWLAQEANEYIIEAVANNPGRLIGFCSVSPNWGAEAVAEVERCTAAGLKGVGELHPDTQGFDIADKTVMEPLMETANRLGLPVLVHASEPVGHQYIGKGRTTPSKLYKFIENFPSNVIICAHWGGGLPFYALMPEVPKVLENVYFDTAASPFLYRPDVFSAVTGLVGANKVLFATDYPLIRARRLLGQVEEACLAPEDQRAVLSRNAARLFGL